MTFDDVAALALELPEAVEGTSYGSRAWKVKGKLAVLVQLDAADDDGVREAIVDAWLCRAPADLAAAYVADQA